MFRRLPLQIVRSARAAPKRFRDGRVVEHQSSRPAEDGDVDFSKMKLKYALTNDINVDDLQARSGWTPPPSEMPELPFHVERSHVGQSLPVYTDYKGGRTKVVTVLRKVSGDVSELLVDLRKVCDMSEIEIRPGKVVIYGNYHWRVKFWLARLGF